MHDSWAFDLINCNWNIQQQWVLHTKLIMQPFRQFSKPNLLRDQSFFTTFKNAPFFVLWFFDNPNQVVIKHKSTHNVPLILWNCLATFKKFSIHRYFQFEKLITRKEKNNKRGNCEERKFRTWTRARIHILARLLRFMLLHRHRKCTFLHLLSRTWLITHADNHLTSISSST